MFELYVLSFVFYVTMYLFNSCVHVLLHIFTCTLIYCKIFTHGPIEKQLMTNGSFSVEINK